MIVSLHIENIAVIKRVDIPLFGGLTVLTGETGAGKSVIIDSIKFILGSRSQRTLVRNGETFGTVSALFCDISEDCVSDLRKIGVEPDENGEMYIQRSITVDGKSTVYFNGRQITLKILKDIGNILLAVHGQHENQNLLQNSKHIDYLDRYANLSDKVREYRSIYSELTELARRISELSEKSKEKARLSEMLEYQISDIDSLKLKRGEEDELEAKRLRIRNSEKIAKLSKIVYSSLYCNDRGSCASDHIERAISALDQLKTVFPDVIDMTERLRSCLCEIEDIADSSRSWIDDETVDSSAALDKIESRLEAISKLKRKYGSDIDEILEYREQAFRSLDELKSSDELIIELKKEYSEKKIKAEKIAENISATRKEYAERLSDSVSAELAFLDMEKAEFYVSVKSSEFNSYGKDSVEFLISTNSGEPLMPLARTASGGELSRVMLAIKSVLADNDSTETLIFDEIDTGISGKTAQKIGIKLKQISDISQVMCVTHSAQIAALANHHIYVSKSEYEQRAETSVTVLKDDERVNEIARIIGGSVITEKTLEAARDLMSYSNMN